MQLDNGAGFVLFVLPVDTPSGNAASVHFHALSLMLELLFLEQESFEYCLPRSEAPYVHQRHDFLESLILLKIQLSDSEPSGLPVVGGRGGSRWAGEGLSHISVSVPQTSFAPSIDP